MLRLHTVIASTRPGRVGLPVGRWFFERAQAHGKFQAELVDLKEVDLPLLDEPEHPRFARYQHAHTRAWSERVKAADAFAFVVPEYNWGVPAPLVNALDCLYQEWNYKPAAFVSYGGASGGMRSVQMTRQILGALKMAPIVESVAIPFVHKQVEEGVFKAHEAQEKSAVALLDELLRWATALLALRT
jgi:NAD(P)H-dependent FMN reductase